MPRCAVNSRLPRAIAKRKLPARSRTSRRSSKPPISRAPSWPGSWNSPAPHRQSWRCPPPHPIPAGNRAPSPNWKPTSSPTASASRSCSRNATRLRARGKSSLRNSPPKHPNQRERPPTPPARIRNSRRCSPPRMQTASGSQPNSARRRPRWPRRVNPRPVSRMPRPRSPRCRSRSTH